MGVEDEAQRRLAAQKEREFRRQRNVHELVALFVKYGIAPTQFDSGEGIVEGWVILPSFVGDLPRPGTIISRDGLFYSYRLPPTGEGLSTIKGPLKPSEMRADAGEWTVPIAMDVIQGKYRAGDDPYEQRQTLRQEHAEYVRLNSPWPTSTKVALAFGLIILSIVGAIVLMVIALDIWEMVH